MRMVVSRLSVLSLFEDIDVQNEGVGVLSALVASDP